MSFFCKIVEGEIPSTKVYEDEHVFAFEDVNPMMPVHTLIVPKNHFDNIADNVPEEELGHLFGAVQKGRRDKGRGGRRVSAWSSTPTMTLAKRCITFTCMFWAARR